MSETLKPVHPVTRGRRIAGSSLVVLGVLVAAATLRAFVSRASMFSYEDWLFVLVGFWLRSRSRTAFWSAALVVVGEISFLAWFDYWVHHLPPPP